MSKMWNSYETMFYCCPVKEVIFMSSMTRKIKKNKLDIQLSMKFVCPNCNRINSSDKRFRAS